MSGWQDGYGEDLTVQEQVQRFYAVSVHQVAKFHDPTDEKFDDLVQEGVVAGWKAAPRATGDPITFGAVSARRRIADVGTGKAPMLGNETKGPTYRPKHTDDLDAVKELLDGSDLLDKVEWSYHHGQIVQVLNSLPLRQREYVYYRFWQGMTDAEIAARKGTTRDTERSLWSRIKPVLARELAHLR